MGVKQSHSRLDRSFYGFRRTEAAQDDQVRDAHTYLQMILFAPAFALFFCCFFYVWCAINCFFFVINLVWTDPNLPT